MIENQTITEHVVKTFNEKCYMCGRTKADFNSTFGIKPEIFDTFFLKGKAVEDQKEMIENIVEYLDKLIENTRHPSTESKDLSIDDLKNGGVLSDKLVPRWRDVLEFAPQSTAGTTRITTLIKSLQDTRRTLERRRDPTILSKEAQGILDQLSPAMLDKTRPRSKLVDAKKVSADCFRFVPYSWDVYFDARGNRLYGPDHYKTLHKNGGLSVEKHESTIKVTVSGVLCPFCTALINDAANARRPEPEPDTDD